jgi:hypothetical protein
MEATSSSVEASSAKDDGLLSVISCGFGSFCSGDTFKNKRPKVVVQHQSQEAEFRFLEAAQQGKKKKKKKVMKREWRAITETQQQQRQEEEQLTKRDSIKPDKQTEEMESSAILHKQKKHNKHSATEEEDRQPDSRQITPDDDELEHETEMQGTHVDEQSYTKKKKKKKNSKPEQEELQDGGDDDQATGLIVSLRFVGIQFLFLSFASQHSLASNPHWFERMILLHFPRLRFHLPHQGAKWRLPTHQGRDHSVCASSLPLRISAQERIRRSISNLQRRREQEWLVWKILPN